MGLGFFLKRQALTSDNNIANSIDANISMSLNDKSEKLFIIGTFVTLTLVSSLRYAVGYDYAYIYAPFFVKVKYLSLSDVFFGDNRHELGFIILQYIISIFSWDFIIFFAIVSILILYLTLHYFHKYSPNNQLAVFFYITFGIFYSSLNFIRQNIAAIIVAFAFMQIKEKNLKKYVLLVVLASLFHQATIVMLPFYFILQIKPTKLIMFLYGFVITLILAFSKPVLYFFINNFFPWYLTKEMESYIETGIPLFYLIVPISCFILVYLNKNLLHGRDYILVNITFFNMIVFILGAKHFIIERFSLYFQFGSIIAIVTIIGLIKQNCYLKGELIPFKNKYFYVSLYFVILSLWLNYILLYNDGHGVVPYATIFGDACANYIKYSALI